VSPGIFDTNYDVPRCEVCNWPLAASAKEGCVPGNCSQRPVPINCFICGKLKGQPPDRCNGHYVGTASDPARIRQVWNGCDSCAELSSELAQVRSDRERLSEIIGKDKLRKALLGFMERLDRFGQGAEMPRCYFIEEIAAAKKVLADTEPGK